MIGKVVRGERVSGLLHYLFGPGRANEHTDPHLAAAWDPPTDLEPALVDGRHDLRHLAAMLQQPLLADFRSTGKSVWHCSLRTAPVDRRLSDAEWDDVVREVLDSTGLAPRGDAGGCRWVAVRHAEDHVHVVLTLARQDGRRVSTSNDFYRVGEACRAVEVRYGLQLTGARDRTAGRRPTRGESEKAARTGRAEEPRVMLRRAVHSAAAVTDSPTDFLAELRSAGVLVRERRSEQNPDQISGFAVSWPGDVNAEGEPVWFGGSKLAPELSWSRLSAQWEGAALNAATAPPAAVVPPGDALVAVPVTGTQDRQQTYRDATQAVHEGVRALRSQRSTGTADDVAAAGGDLVAATGRLMEGRVEGTVRRVADRYQRAARAPWGRTPAPSAAGASLRRAARHLARLKRATHDEADDVAELLRAVGSLAIALAELRAAQQRPEQALAAREAAAVLTGTALAIHRAAPSPFEDAAPARTRVVPRPRSGRSNS